MTIIKDSKTKLVLTSTNTVILIKTDSGSLIVNQNQDKTVVSSEKRETLFVTSPGPQGPPGNVGQFQFNKKVEVGNTEVIDGVPTSLVDHVRWIVVARDGTNDLRRSFEVSANHSSGSPSHVLSYLFGPTALMAVGDIDVQIQSGNLNLLISNNYTEDLILSVIRLKIDTVTI